MSEIVALAKLMAQQAGTVQRITRHRGFPLSTRPLVMIPIVMAGESPALFGLGIGNGNDAAKVYVCANPINRAEQYEMLAKALKAGEPTLLSWQGSNETPQIIVTGTDSARLVLGIIDRSVYSQHLELTAIGRQLAWFDHRSDCPDSACLLILPKALAACLATGQDEFADQHLGAFLEWCRPADGKIWERVARAEQLPASGATSPDFDRHQLEPAFNAYTAAVRDRNHSIAAGFRQQIEDLIGDEIRRRYELVKAALRELVVFPASALAVEVAGEDRRTFLHHLTYVADPNHHLRRGLNRNMQTSEFMTREFSMSRVEGLGVRSVSSVYAKAGLSGDLLEGEVVESTRSKLGRRTTVLQTIASTQHLSLRAGDKLSLLADDRFAFRVEDIAVCSRTSRTLVRVDVVAGKTLANLPAQGDWVAMVPPLRDQQSLSRARTIAWTRMRAQPVPVQMPQPPVISRDWSGVVASLRGQK